MHYFQESHLLPSTKTDLLGIVISSVTMATFSWMDWNGKHFATIIDWNTHRMFESRLVVNPLIIKWSYSQNKESNLKEFRKIKEAEFKRYRQHILILSEVKSIEIPQSTLLCLASPSGVGLWLSETSDIKEKDACYEQLWGILNVTLRW